VQGADLLQNVDREPPGSGPAAAEDHDRQALHHVQDPQQRGPVQGQGRGAARDLLANSGSFIIILLLLLLLKVPL